MNIACPECDTVYRIDPARVPHGGIVATCRECGVRMRIEGGEAAPGAVRTASLATAAAPAVEGASAQAGGEVPARGEATGDERVEAPPTAAAPRAGGTDTAVESASRPTTPVFGPQDPDTRAKRLARALVSDIVVYNPEKWEESRAAGTLRKEFRDEILKSWEEYVEQVGREMAKRTPYFREALNAILADGKEVF